MHDFFVSLMLLGALSSSGSLPFWMTTGQYGLLSDSTLGLAQIQAHTEFEPQKTLQWRWGASLALAEDAVPQGQPVSRTMVDELYVSARWKVFTLDVGSKRRPQEFLCVEPLLGSLSVTSGHVLESAQARTLPGVQLSLDPVPIPWTQRHVWLYGAYGDYRTVDRRFIQGALVHRTRIGLRGDIGERLSLHFELDHAAQWGGTHPDFGAMPAGFGNYLRVIFGQAAGADGTLNDQLNVLGNQLGSELFKLSYRGEGWRFVAQHDIPYDDGSGMGFQNFPDGVNTLFLGWDDPDRWVTGLLYEYHYTMFQSGPINRDSDPDLFPNGKTTGGDNYFNNGEYRSGWTHFGRPIGEPLFFPAGTRSGTWNPYGVTLGVENNRLKAHHLGVSGKLFRAAPYRLVLTWSRNYGVWRAPYAGESAWAKPWGTVREIPLHQFSASFTGAWDHLLGCRGLTGLYGLYLDRGEVLPQTLGFSLGLRYCWQKNDR